MIGFDLETYLILVKRAPKIVVGAFNVSTEVAQKFGVESFATKVHDYIEDNVDEESRSIYFVPACNMEQMLDFFVASGEVIAAHNGSFDYTCLAAHAPGMVDKLFQLSSERRLQCTYIRSLLHANATGVLKSTQGSKIELQHDKVGVHSLAGTLYRFCEGLDISEMKDHEIQTSYHKVEGLPPSEWPSAYRDYLIQDVLYLNYLYYAQTMKGYEFVHTQSDHKSVYEEGPRRTTFHFALSLASAWGVKVDLDSVADIKQSGLEELHSIADMMVSNGFASRLDGIRADRLIAQSKPPIQMNQKALQEAVQASMQALGKEVPLTKKGTVSTSRQTLMESGNEVLVEYARGGAHRTIMNTFIPALQRSSERGGVVNTTFFPMSETGRISARSPNLLNPPRSGGVRECIVAREGCTFIFSDYESNELRVLGQVLLDEFSYSRLAQLYRQDPNFDCHTYMAAQSLKVSYEEGMALKKAGDKEFKGERQRMKCCNFGFPGGMAAVTFVEYCKGFGLDISIEEAEHLKKFFFEQFPEIKEYLNLVGKRVDRHGGQGYLPRVGRITGGRSFCQLANFYFQGLAAEGGLTAFTVATRDAHTNRQSPLWGTRPVLFIHDEIILEAPIHKTHEAAMELKRVMETSMRIFTPDVPSVAEPAAATRWMKDAYTKFDAEGRLIPCDLD